MGKGKGKKKPRPKRKSKRQSNGGHSQQPPGSESDDSLFSGICFKGFAQNRPNMRSALNPAAQAYTPRRNGGNTNGTSNLRHSSIAFVSVGVHVPEPMEDKPAAESDAMEVEPATAKLEAMKVDQLPTKPDAMDVEATAEAKPEAQPDAKLKVKLAANTGGKPNGADSNPLAIDSAPSQSETRSLCAEAPPSRMNITDTPPTQPKCSPFRGDVPPFELKPNLLQGTTSQCTLKSTLRPSATLFSPDRLFVVDRLGQKSSHDVAAELFQPIENPTSPTSSSSSEVILFKGRGVKTNQPFTRKPQTNITKPDWHDKTVPRSARGSSPGWPPLESYWDDLPPMPARLKSPPALNNGWGWKDGQTAESLAYFRDQMRESLRGKRGINAPGKRGKKNPANEVKEAAMADYVSNLLSHEGLGAFVPEGEWESCSSSSSSSDDEDEYDEQQQEEEELIDLDSDDDEDEEEYTLAEQFSDEADLRQRHTDAMTDEEIAELLSSFKKKVGKGKARDPFPSATALADALAPPKDKNHPPADLTYLSDPELKATLLQSWSADREAKRLKKAERRKLREEGLLSSSGKVDLKQKYRKGSMTTAQMRKELRVFMADEGRESVSFPPMNTAERKVLHNLAGKLGCKSKSMGKGKQRFTIVSKTEKSKHHGQEEVEVDYWGRGGKKHRGRSKHEASVRHGEVVGAGAPELSSESLGHKLMEKMGWVKGTALGKEGSGGRLLPVEQIMRSGKTGLGG